VSWKRRVRAALDRGAQGLGVLRTLEKRMLERPTVLMHHRVLPGQDCRDYPFPSLAISAELFQAQVEWLSRHVELRTLRGAFAKPAGDKPVVAITFDDGYWDNYALAAPILEAHGACGTFFVTTGFVSGETLMWYDRAALALPAASDERLAAAAQQHGVPSPPRAEIDGDRTRAWVEALKRASSGARAAFVDAIESAVDAKAKSLYAPMTPGQVLELAARGHEIGAHSQRHEILTLCDDAQLESELVGSRARVEEWIAAPSASFCYPNGSHDERVVEATRKAGFEFACTTEPPHRDRPADPLRIPRIDVTRDRLTDEHGRFDAVALRAELCGFHEALR